MQALLFRERFAIFQGLDFVLGISGAHFIAGIFAGLLFLHKSKSQIGYQSIAYLIIGSFLLSFILTRLIGLFIDIPFGSPFSLLSAFIYSFLITFLPTFFQSYIVGIIQFNLQNANPPVSKQSNDTPEAAAFHPLHRLLLLINKVPPIQITALGYIVGSSFFSLALIKVNSSAIALFVCCLLSALTITKIKNKQKKIVLLISIAFLAIIGGKFSLNVDKALLKMSFKNSTIENISYSPYAQNVLINKNGQRFLFSNHIPILSLPDDKAINAQDFAHLSLLSHNNPQNILIISDASRYIPSALKYNADIDYLEPDESIQDILKHKRSDLFNDEKISFYSGIVAKDFIKDRQYDVIILGAAAPANLFLNSYYTQEFFAAAAKSLKKGGLLALSLPGTKAYPLFLIMELNASVIAALEKSFDFVNIIPAAAQNIIIASQDKPPLRVEIKNRLTKVQDETFVMSKYHIDDRMDSRKTAWTLLELAKIDKGHFANSDFHAHALIFDFLRRLSDRHPIETSLLKKGGQAFYVFFALAALAVFIRDKRKKTALMSGISSVWLSFVSIFLLQIQTGKILKFSGIFTALTLIGILAAAASEKFIFKQTLSSKALFYTDAAYLLWICAFFAALKFKLINPTVLFASALFTAFICALEIISLIKNKKASETPPSNDIQTMIFFAAGAWFAALFGGGYLILAMGFEKALIFVFLIRFLIFCFWADLKKH